MRTYQIVRSRRAALSALALSVVAVSSVHAAPYAGEVAVAGAAGSFYLNESATSAVIHFGNGSSQTFTTPAAGKINFTLPSAGSTFSITVTGNDGPGWTSGAALQVGHDSALTVFNSPRGVIVNRNPGPNFGRIYVSNSSASATNISSASGTIRPGALSQGIYSLNADQSDGFGYGNVAKTGGISQLANGNTSIPYRMAIGPDDSVYTTDASNNAGNIYRLNSTLISGTNLLFGFPVGNTGTADTLNHGMFFSSPVLNVSGGQVVSITAIDDLLGAPNTRNNPTAVPQFNAIRTYTVGSGAPTAALPETFVANPTVGPAKLNEFSLPVGGLTTDLARGPLDNRYYYVESRLFGTDPTLFVIDPATGNTIYDSLSATRTITGNPTSADLLQNCNCLAISPDNKYMALLTTSTDSPNAIGNVIHIVPLDLTIGGLTGLPDLANAMTIKNAFPTDFLSGRDVNFDAADNLYAISSGQEMMRVFSPGGPSVCMTSFDGTNYSFAATVVPEPSSVGLIATGAIGIMGRRRRAIRQRRRAGFPVHL